VGKGTPATGNRRDWGGDVRGHQTEARGSGWGRREEKHGKERPEIGRAAGPRGPRGGITALAPGSGMTKGCGSRVPVGPHHFG